MIPRFSLQCWLNDARDSAGLLVLGRALYFPALVSGLLGASLISHISTPGWLLLGGCLICIAGIQTSMRAVGSLGFAQFNDRFGSSQAAPWLRKEGWGSYLATLLWLVATGASAARSDILATVALSAIVLLTSYLNEEIRIGGEEELERNRAIWQGGRREHVGSGDPTLVRGLQKATIRA
jgi:hypothetical protein